LFNLKSNLSKGNRNSEVIMNRVMKILLLKGLILGIRDFLLLSLGYTIRV